MFAQVQSDAPLPPEYAPEVLDPTLSPLFGGAMAVIWLAYTVFWIWMLIHCLKHDPDRWLWGLVIFFISFPGAIIYFFARYLPSSEVRPPQALRKWTRGREIARLELEAQQIGNPHQYIRLGDALREVGQIERARDAYSRALAKDNGELQALWGTAQCDLQANRFAEARAHLARALEINPQYKFGDVSLAYGKTLYALEERAEAEAHLEQHIRRWRQPEALYLLANLLAERDEYEQARKHLQSLLMDLNTSPAAIARKHGVWKSRARKMLKLLPRSESTV